MGGVGKRFQSSEPKQFVLLHGRELGLYSIEAFEDCDAIDSMVIVVPKDFVSQMKKMVSREGFKKVAIVVEGGKTRGESVCCGLKACDEDTMIVCIHDGVRPLVKAETVHKAILLCEESDAVVVGVRVKSTIKCVGDNQEISSTLDRDLLWEAQTPQVFKKELILEAYEKGVGQSFTDDSALVEQMGVPVKMLEGNYSNVKVTTPDDLFVADAFLQEWEA